MSSYQTFPQVDEPKQSQAIGGRKRSAVAVIVAAFCLGAAYISTNRGPAPANELVADATPTPTTMNVCDGDRTPAKEGYPAPGPYVVTRCVEIKCCGASPPTANHVLHAIDAMPARRRSGRYLTARRSQQGRVIVDARDSAATPWLISTQVTWHVWDHAQGMGFASRAEAETCFKEYDENVRVYAVRLYDANMEVLEQYGSMNDWHWDELRAWAEDFLDPAAPETCTRAAFQRDVALDIQDINAAAFGTSNDKQTLAKSFKVPGENGERDKYFLHFYDATTGEEKRDPIPLTFDAAFVAVTNNNDRAAICYAGNSYGVIDIPCLDRGGDQKDCVFESTNGGLANCASVAMAPDERTVAFSAGRGSCMGGLVTLLKTYSPQEPPVEFEHRREDIVGCPALLAYSPDGTLAVAGRTQDNQGLVAMHDGTTGELLERVELGLDGLPWLYGTIEYSNDGQVLALGGTKVTNRPADPDAGYDSKDVIMLYDVLNKTVTAELDRSALPGLQPDDGHWSDIRAAWSPDDKYVVGSYDDWGQTRLGVFDAATGALLDDVKIDSFSQTRVDFVGFTGDQCGDACQDLVASSFIRSSFSSTRNNLNFYDVLTLDADDARCQPTPAPVPHSDGATALAAGLAVPALAALAL